MSVDRIALKVVIAALDVEQRELAAEMGYQPAYVANVLNGFTPPSDAFKRAFGDAVAERLLGCSPRARRHLPAEPFAGFLEAASKSAPSRTRFYADLGLSIHGWGKRLFVTERLVDRVCCELGVHPTSIYGHEYFEEAS